MTIGKYVVYRGRVQGVGFRYTAHRIAQGYAVTGYVRNLPDGSVELVAEGADDQVEAFLTAMADRMVDYIRQTTVQERSPGGYTDFSIRH
jgi:acylphosphatase